MTKELETMFCMLYGECCDFYSDKRHGEDDIGLSFDRGAISAFKRAAVMLASDNPAMSHVDVEAVSRAADALKDEAYKDERTGRRKSDDEVVALARELMGEVRRCGG